MTSLVDSSAWIDFLNRADSPARWEVRRLIETDEPVVMCEPVAMELLCGPTDDLRLARIRRLIDGLPSLAVDATTDFRDAARIYRATRQTGRTVRAVNDCLIAAIALRHGATLVHKDADYTAICAVTGQPQVDLLGG